MTNATQQEQKRRFWDYVLVPETPCFIWNGARDKDGYGKYRVGSRHVRAHRFVLEFCGVIIPEGVTVDHLCRNPTCVNPNHLDLASMKENIQRGRSANGERTHCLSGHAYDEGNTAFHGPQRKWRRCRRCHREAEAARRKRASL